MAQEGSEASVASSSSPNPNWWETSIINPFNPLSSSWSSSSSNRWPPPQPTSRRNLSDACDSTSPPLAPATENHLWKQFLSSLASNQEQRHGGAGDEEHFHEVAAPPPPPFDYLKRMDGGGAAAGDSWPESFMLNPSGGGGGAPAVLASSTYLQYLNDSSDFQNNCGGLVIGNSNTRPPWEGLIGCCSSSSSSWAAASASTMARSFDVASDVISFKPVDLQLRASSNKPPPPQDNNSNKKPRGAGAAESAGKKKKRSDVDEAAAAVPPVKKSAKHESSSSSSSMLKLQVPKVKLGERITALQQIVSPFGRTDTASVLMEAINCIKFLQEQIQLLSDPYMKSGANKEVNMMSSWGGGLTTTEATTMIRKAAATGKTNHDLKSRKLCLVSISCLPPSYRESSATPDYWTPTFRGCLHR